VAIYCIYENGIGVTQNYSKAFELYSKAAEQGEAHAHYNLGKLYLDGKGVTKNSTKAIELFTKAADQGIEDAQQQLANLQKR